MKKKVSVLLFFVFIQFRCFSQLTVTPNSTATALAQAILGTGVSVSNATLNCGANGAGNFNYSGSTLGITNGIILTTGYATDATVTPAQIISESTGNNFTDPDLATITPVGVSGSMNDVCYIAFDFVPLCNQISITYEFGSSEYNGFQCSAFNDAFGLFITGPNPAGGNYTSSNAALLPNGTPVSINNINDGNPLYGNCTSPNNPSYYVGNYSGTDVVYEGLTTAITSIKPVIPCSTYTLKIAICDMGDEAYDSGVFIQGNSLNCANTPTITTSTTAANCGNTGSATVTVTNYTGTPTYQWLPGNATTPAINNLAAGTYTCLVGLQSGCGTITQTVTAVVPSTGATFSYTPSTLNPACNNGTNGSAGVVVSGGTAPYTYTWSTTPVQNTATATNLPAGTYVVNVTDNIGCSGSTTLTLTNPPPIVATVTTTPTTCTASIGTAGATIVSGGTAPFSYAWSTSPAQLTQTATGLAQGVYTVGIMDVNTCTATATGTVNVQGFSWTASSAGTNPGCALSSTGSATVTIANQGTNTITYSWTPSGQTNATATGLPAGNYTATMTDNNGCVSISTLTLTDPPPITATVNTTPTICTGSVGSATITVLSGGVAPYNYSWITTSPIQSGPVASNLAQATYSVLVTDVNNCPFIFSGTVSSTGFTWVPTVNTTPAKCFGSTDGSATVTVSTLGTYNYTWTPSAQTSNTATNLAPGTVYTVTVEDNNACISTVTTTVTQPTQIVANTQTGPAICTAANGNAHAIATGGTPGYTYTWLTNPLQNSQNASGLAQGQYTVLVSDVNSCTTTAIAIVGDTTDLTVTATQSPDLCNKGVGKAIAHPVGQSPYHYQWSTNPVDTNQIAGNLQIGPYSVNVMDANGCTASASVTVLNQNDILTSQLITTPEGDIYAENQTVLTISNNAGWSPDTAYLAPATGSDSIPITTPSFTYVFPKYGDYTATYYFTSVHGCKDTVTYDIIVKDYLTLYIPNAFTPNGDGKNDMFGAAGTFVNTFEMYIYDRWGVLVTKLDNINKVWDGTKNGGIVPEDTYVYKGAASDVFGKHVTFNGQVNLIR